MNSANSKASSRDSGGLTRPVWRLDKFPGGVDPGRAGSRDYSGGRLFVRDAGQKDNPASPRSAPPEENRGRRALNRPGYYSASAGKIFRPIMGSRKYALYVSNDGAKPPRHVVQVRAEQGKKLRSLYRSLGWTRDDARKFFHTSERTLRNWKSGRSAILLVALDAYLSMEIPAP